MPTPSFLLISENLSEDMKKKGKGRHYSKDDDPSYSSSSISAAADFEEEEEEDTHHKNSFSTSMSDIMDRKPAVRVKGFNATAKHLSSHVIPPEHLESFCETLGTYAAKAIERGSPAEVAAAVQACLAYAASVGPCDPFYNLVAPACLKAFSTNNSTGGSSTRHLQVQLAAVVNFFCSEDIGETVKLAGLLRAALLETTRKKRPSALMILELVRAWNLVAPAVPGGPAENEEDAKQTLCVFMAHITASETSTELRKECLYGLAILIERLSAGKQQESRWESDASAVTRADFPGLLDVEELEDACRMAALAASKKDKAEEQRVFRAVCGYIVDGTKPSATTVKVNRQKLVFGTWREIYRFGVVSRIFGGHLNTHLAGNQVVMDVLGYSMEGAAAAGGFSGHVHRERDPERAKMTNIKRARDRDAKASSMAWD